MHFLYPFQLRDTGRGVMIPLHTTPAPKTDSDFPRLGRTCGLTAGEPEQGRRDEEMSANKVCLKQAAEFRGDSGLQENSALPSGVPKLICSPGTVPWEPTLARAGHSPPSHPQTRL